MAATPANQGVNPVTGETVFKPASVKDLLSVMFTCGIRHTNGMWAYRVGLPAESSVSGAMMMVVPQQMGIAIFPHPSMSKTTAFEASKSVKI